MATVIQTLAVPELVIFSVIALIFLYQLYCDITLVKIRANEEGRRVIIWPRGSKRRRLRWFSVLVSLTAIPFPVLLILRSSSIQLLMFFLFWGHPLMLHCAILVAEIFTQQIYKQFQKLLPEWHEQLFKKASIIAPLLYLISFVLLLVMNLQGLAIFSASIVFATSIMIGVSIFISLRLVTNGVEQLIGDAKMMFAVDKDREIYLGKLIERTKKIAWATIWIMICVCCVSMYFIIDAVKYFSDPLVPIENTFGIIATQCSFAITLVLVVTLLYFSWIPPSEIKRKSLTKVKMIDLMMPNSSSNELKEEKDGKEEQKDGEVKDFEKIAVPGVCGGGVEVAMSDINEDDRLEYV